MKNNERLLYQKNMKGYTLIILSIICNAIYSIFTLNTMDRNYYLGAEVMITILMLLAGFLIAVKIQNYSFKWSFGALSLGLIQIIRLILSKSMAEGSLLFKLQLVLILSALFSIAGGLFSILVTKKRIVEVAKQEQQNG